MKTIYQFSANISNRIGEQFKICKVCKIKIKIGDKVVSSSRTGSIIVLRHYECARKVNVI